MRLCAMASGADVCVRTRAAAPAVETWHTHAAATQHASQQSTMYTASPSQRVPISPGWRRTQPPAPPSPHPCGGFSTAAPGNAGARPRHHPPRTRSDRQAASVGDWGGRIHTFAAAQEIAVEEEAAGCREPVPLGFGVHARLRPGLPALNGGLPESSVGAGGGDGVARRGTAGASPPGGSPIAADIEIFSAE